MSSLATRVCGAAALAALALPLAGQAHAAETATPQPTEAAAVAPAPEAQDALTAAPQEQEKKSVEVKVPVTVDNNKKAAQPMKQQPQPLTVPQAPAAKAPRVLAGATANLNGDFFLDNNLNGKFDGGDTALQGTVITLEDNDGTKRTTKVDKKGHFGFAAVPEGRAKITWNVSGVKGLSLMGESSNTEAPYWNNDGYLDLDITPELQKVVPASVGFVPTSTPPAPKADPGVTPGDTPTATPTKDATKTEDKTNTTTDTTTQETVTTKPASENVRVDSGSLEGAGGLASTGAGALAMLAGAAFAGRRKLFGRKGD